MKSKYINPFTDFGFKKIFGEEASKPLLLDFLNAFLPESGKIVDLTFKNSEQHGDTNKNWNAAYTRRGNLVAASAYWLCHQAFMVGNTNHCWRNSKH